ncbi:MAG: branched-chain amino acid transport system substrate-binding protein [Hyphomicrobiales bacterium]|nr:branched-chain amino acid transport system substrate-binding protein [Hyphomicrobiales bacterium]
MRRILIAAAIGLFATAASAQDLKIALIYGKTGPLEAYAKQTETGLRMGFEYATKGTMVIDGRKIVIITKDDQGKPDVAKTALAEAYEDDKVDLAIGTTASPAALAMLPIAEERKKVLIVEPAVADSITGDKWNRYIFRTGRNSSQDAISNAVAIGKQGVTIATLGQDNAFGRDGVAAFKEALAKTGATIAAEEYAPAATTDFTASAQRLFDALKDKPGKKIIWVIWAGPTPLTKLQDMNPGRYGVELSSGGNILPAMAAYKTLPGMEGATYYYHDIPQNDVNKWFVAEHQKRFNAPPDFFTAGGFAAAMAAATAVSKARSTDTEKLIAAMEGMEFDTPKGKMVFRKEDHQAMQSMYHFKIKADPAVAWGIPELVRELKIEDMTIPVKNKR